MAELLETELKMAWAHYARLFYIIYQQRITRDECSFVELLCVYRSLEARGGKQAMAFAWPAIQSSIQRLNEAQLALISL